MRLKLTPTTTTTSKKFLQGPVGTNCVVVVMGASVVGGAVTHEISL